jgi:hypothetical protein
MLSHPFPVDRLSYLKNWANSEEYYRIKAGNYARSQTDSTVNVNPSSNTTEVDRLRQELAELQNELDRLRRS